MRRWQARGGRVAALSVVAFLALTACGSGKWHYITSSAEHTYAKIPRSWHRIDSRQIKEGLLNGVPGTQTREIERSLLWVDGYDAAASPSVEHLLRYFDSATEPVAYAQIRELPPPERGLNVAPGEPGLQRFPESERGSVSLDSLRNSVLPVTDQARASVAEQGYDTTFELLSEEILTPSNGIHGVRIVFNYAVNDSPVETFNQTAYTNADASKVYLFLVHCNAVCYSNHLDEIDEVAGSFTVEGS
jgi:hypothetical protein